MKFPRAEQQGGKGVYCSLGTFRSRAVEWEETVHQDTGLLGFTKKADRLRRWFRDEDARIDVRKEGR